MITNIIYLLLICSGSVWCAARFNRSFEETLPLTAMGTVFIVFLFGVCGWLKIGVALCLCIALVLYIITLILLITKKSLSCFFKNTVTPGSVIFIFIFFILSLFNYGRVASSWDEFSHWVDIVKVMSTLNDFGTNPASSSAFQSYPPGMSIFQYILQRIFLWVNPDGVFNEWRVFFSYQIFCLIPLFPLFKNCSFKKPLTSILYSVALFLTPLIFYSNLYKDTYIDAFLGIVAGSGLAIILLWKNKGKLYTLTICAYCATLVLAKDAGLMFALFLALAFAIDFSLRTKKQELLTFSWRKIGTLTSVFLAIFITKFLWTLELRTSGATVNFSNKVDMRVLIKLLLGKDDTYRTTVWDNFCYAMFDNNITLGHSNITVNFFTLTIFCLLMLYLLYKLYSKKLPEQRCTFVSVLSVVAVQLLIYIIGLSITYMFKFSEFEAVKLASFNRYINIVFLCSWIVIIIALVYAIDTWLKGKTISVCLLCLLLIITPLKSTIQLANGYYVESSQEVREAYQPIKNLIHKHCDGDDKIYFIAQDDSGLDFWISRFNARPNSFSPNFSWSLGKSDYAGGMYAKVITAEEWKKQLTEEYDYVAIYKLNDCFLKEYGCLFKDPTKITANTLYKVNTDSGLLEKCE